MFVKGLLTPKWSKIQEKYILHEELPSNCNIVRWKKKVSEILLLHCVLCYKERYTIIAAETKSAHEQHIRHKAMELLQDVKNNKWKITHDVSHLTDRTANFFEYGNITNITEWTKNMTTAIERSTRRTKENACNLEKFFKITKPTPRPKNRLIVEFKKKLSEKATSIRNKFQQNISNLLISLKR